MWLVLASFPVSVVKFPDKKELQGGRDYLELHFKVSVHSGGGMKAAGACEGGHITSQSGTKTGGGCTSFFHLVQSIQDIQKRELR